MPQTIDQHLVNELKTLRETGLFKEEQIIRSTQSAEVTLAENKQVINFCANNYLGLADHPRLIAASIDGLRNRGIGMASSPK